MPRTIPIHVSQQAPAGTVEQSMHHCTSTQMMPHAHRRHRWACGSSRNMLLLLGNGRKSIVGTSRDPPQRRSSRRRHAHHPHCAAAPLSCSVTTAVAMTTTCFARCSAATKAACSMWPVTPQRIQPQWYHRTEQAKPQRSLPLDVGDALRARPQKSVFAEVVCFETVFSRCVIVTKIVANNVFCRVLMSIIRF